MSPPLLDVQGLSVSLGGREAVRDVSLRVDAGEVVTLLGRNGAGKSTLLRAILGLVAPSRGMVLLRGTDVTPLSPKRKAEAGIGYMPQADNVFLSLTVRENLELGGRLRGRRSRDRLERVLQMFPDLATESRTRARALTGSARQALALARTLMIEPALLLLDEPASLLTPAQRHELLTRLAALARRGTAVLLVEQHAREALSIADRGYVLENGHCVIEGEASDLLERRELGRLVLGLDEAPRVARGSVEAGLHLV